MLASLALRNIWRNRRRTLLTLSAMVVSSSLLILALGVFSGMMEDMLTTSTGQYYGHLVINRPGYQDDRDLYAAFAPPEQLLATLSSNSRILEFSPRLRGFGLLSHGMNTRPAELLGVQPKKERQVTGLQDSLIQGEYLQPGDADGVVLGVELATRLGLSTGDELVFFTQAADGSIGNDILVVRGIFSTGDKSRDNALALVPLPWLQRVLALPGSIHELSLRIERPMEAAALAQSLQVQIPPDLEILDWGALLPEMREAIASFDISRMIVVIILYFATALGILNTFFMSVMERTREFGVLMAIGMRPWRVRTLVLLETLIMGVISLVLGVGLGLALTLYMAQVGIDLSGNLTPVTYAGGTILPRLHAVFDFQNFLVPALALLLISLLAGFLPANRAARMKPVQALREDG